MSTRAWRIGRVRTPMRHNLASWRYPLVVIRVAATLLVLWPVTACGHDLDPLRAGFVDAGMDGAPDGSPRGDSSPPPDDGGPRCDSTTCTTDLECHEAVCRGDLCVVQPRCGLGEQCCGDTCVPVGCNDGVECTEDSCGADGCVNTPLNAVCDAAAGGTCDPETGCQYPDCNTSTCVAGPCVTATCVGSTCERTPTCSAAQECCAGACVPLGCDDGIVCTDDLCGASGCEHMDNTADCDDGITCNGPDTCSGGTCSLHDTAAAEHTRCGTMTERCCGGACVDTRNDVDHCGTCGNRCTAECNTFSGAMGVTGACNCSRGDSCATGSCRMIGGSAAFCGCGPCATGQVCDATSAGFSACFYSP